MNSNLYHIEVPSQRNVKIYWEDHPLITEIDNLLKVNVISKGFNVQEIVSHMCSLLRKFQVDTD